MSGGRKRSAGDVYHVMARGVGRQIIFEDEADRRFFLRQMEGFLDKQRDAGRPIAIYAWCLMSNHFHLLIRGELVAIASFLHDLMSLYARFFNTRHGRVGTLFQGRFASRPVRNDGHLLVALRYIHQNPLEAGQPLDNRWSSYREYIREPWITDTAYCLDVLGGRDAFVLFHTEDGAECDNDNEFEPLHLRRTADELFREAKQIAAPFSLYELREAPKPARNQRLRAMKEAGLSIRDIERYTGIGRGIISRT
ncbi:MAG: transposase [Eggerthellaceae bacterium]|nr:transposase [Eggerthellaceae bacterium]